MEVRQLQSDVGWLAKAGRRGDETCVHCPTCQEGWAQLGPSSASPDGDMELKRSVALRLGILGLKATRRRSKQPVEVQMAAVFPHGQVKVHKVKM